MKIVSSTILILVSGMLACGTRNNLGHHTENDVIRSIDHSFQAAAAQYRALKHQLPADRFPRSFNAQTGELVTSNSSWWCSGFYPGTLLNLYEQTGDTVLYNEALRMLGMLEKEKNNKGTHDLGFMMFCSFGNALRIAPKREYNEILLTSARSLATRFDPKVGLIRSWDGKPDEYLVIIDNMMNLELLFWATRHSGDSSFYRIAVTHANNTIRDHYRPDFSSYHVVNYHPLNGTVQQKRTAQGFADGSAWARGQAWGLYGFTMSYRATSNAKYLEQARKIAQFILDHPNLPKDKIPYWDFNAPGIPAAPRDASAAAIIASALLELSGYVNKKEGNRYFETAEKMLRTLSAAEYFPAVDLEVRTRNTLHTNGGFILQHGVGHFPQGSEVDVPLTYADYYFVEALSRYKNLLR